MINSIFFLGFSGSSATASRPKQLRPQLQNLPETPPQTAVSNDRYWHGDIPWKQHIAAFLEDHRLNVIRHLQGKGASFDDAQDSAQSAIIKTAENANQTLYQSSFGITTINLLYLNARHAWIEHRRLAENRYTKAWDLNANFPLLKDERNLNEEIHVSNNFDHGMLWCLEHQPEHARMAYFLRNQYDLSYEIIAQLLDIPIGTVRSRINSANTNVKNAQLQSAPSATSLQELKRGKLQVIGSSVPSFYYGKEKHTYTLNQIRDLLKPLESHNLEEILTFKIWEKALISRVAEADTFFQQMNTTPKNKPKTK